MKNTQEKSFSFKKANNQIGEIIACAIFIEESISEILITYFQPKNERKFRKILLNSNVTGYGQKLKILSNIEGFESKIIEKLRKLGALRNSVAHSNLSIKMSPDKILLTVEDLEDEIKLSVMNSSGRLVDQNFNSILEEFQKLYNETSNYLEKYHLSLQSTDQNIC